MGGVEFVGGKVRAQVTWEAIESGAGFSFKNCPVTTVQLDYTIARSDEMPHGAMTTVKGDPSCG